MNELKALSSMLYGMSSRVAGVPQVSALSNTLKDTFDFRMNELPKDLLFYKSIKKTIITTLSDVIKFVEEEHINSDLIDLGKLLQELQQHKTNIAPVLPYVLEQIPPAA